MHSVQAKNVPKARLQTIGSAAKALRGRLQPSSRSKRDRLRKGAVAERANGGFFMHRIKSRRERCDVRGDVACPTRFERAAFRVGVADQYV